MKKFLLFLTLLVSAIGLTHAAVQKTDVITRNSFTTTSKEYAEDKCNGSETGEAAQYTAGIYFGTKDFMQFKNGAYGIWVNKTPGKLVSIQIVFNGTPNFSSKKACNVYGNTSVYNAAAKVPAGDLIQTITTAASSTVTVDFTNGTQDYVAFYISSVDGAKYITQLSVTWEIAGTGGEGPTPTDPENSPVIEFNFAEIFGTGSNVVFSNDTKEVNGASITCKDGSTKTQYYSSDKTLRLYTGGTITVAAPEGFYITKIVFTSGDEWKIACDAQNGTLSGDTKTWTYTEGKATSNSVTFKATAKTFFKKITVYCAKDSNLKDAKFAFESTTVYKWIDDEPFTNTLTYAEEITDGIVYSIENPQDVTVAEINETTGEVTIIGVGTAKITATRPEDETFKKGEASYTLVVSKHPHGLAYTPSSVTLEPGEGLTEQPTLKNDNTLVVTYSSSNEAVATVTDDGTISLAGATGQAVIYATFAGNDTYEAGSATFTISVREPIDQVANFSLVTNINDLQAGDIIVIACPEKTKVMSTEENSTYRPSVIATFSDDNRTLTTPANGLQLQVEKSDEGFWMFRTTNYGTNGYLSSSNTAKNCIISETVTDYAKAKIVLSETGVATILFNKGAESTASATTLLTYNNTNNKENKGLFSCYAPSLTSKKDIFIYKFASNQQTIVGEDLTEVTISEPTGASSIDAMSIFETNSSADTFVVKMNGVEITSANVTKEAGTSTTLTVNLSGLPYIPGAEFTIAPVVNGVEGHSEVLGIQMPKLPLLDFSSKEMALYFDSEAYANEKTCDLDIWVYLTVDMKDPSSPENSLAADDTRRNLTFSFVEFDNSQEGQIYGWYTPYEKVQWCKHKFFTDVDVVDGQPDTSKLNNDQTIKLTFNAYFTFNVSAELASLIPAPESAPMAAPARAGEAAVIQTVSQTTPLTYSQKLPESLSSIVSGVEGVTVDANAPVEFFNLQGVRVDGALAPGIYIRRQGQAVSKVRIN